MFKLDKGFQVELNAWTYRKLRRIAALPIVLGLNVRPNNGIQFEIPINFRYELGVLCTGRQARETNEKCAPPNRLVNLRHYLGLGPTVCTWTYYGPPLCNSEWRAQDVDLRSAL